MLNIGTTTITIDGYKHTYCGTVNQAGEAFGLGKATDVEDPNVTWTGTFYKNMLHGKSKNCIPLSLIFISALDIYRHAVSDNTYIYEYRMGKAFGKSTGY